VRARLLERVTERDVSRGAQGSMRKMRRVGSEKQDGPSQAQGTPSRNQGDVDQWAHGDLSPPKRWHVPLSRLSKEVQQRRPPIAFCESISFPTFRWSSYTFEQQHMQGCKSRPPLVGPSPTRVPPASPMPASRAASPAPVLWEHSDVEMDDPPGPAPVAVATKAYAVGPAPTDVVYWEMCTYVDTANQRLGCTICKTSIPREKLSAHVGFHTESRLTEEWAAEILAKHIICPGDESRVPDSLPCTPLFGLLVFPGYFRCVSRGCAFTSSTKRTVRDHVKSEHGGGGGKVKHLEPVLTDVQSFFRNRGFFPVLPLDPRTDLPHGDDVFRAFKALERDVSASFDEAPTVDNQNTLKTWLRREKWHLYVEPMSTEQIEAAKSRSKDSISRTLGMWTNEWYERLDGVFERAEPALVEEVSKMGECVAPA
jgi:hypothetical protein